MSSFVPRAAKRLRLSTRTVTPLPIRAFSSSPYLAEQKPNNEKTTHFGFESIAESLKESKGKDISFRIAAIATLQKNRQLTEKRNSRCRLQLRRLLLRHHERPHVPRHPPPLERPLRPQPKPRQPHPRRPPNRLEDPRHRRRHRRHRLPHPRPRDKHKPRPKHPRHNLRHQPGNAGRRSQTRRSFPLQWHRQIGFRRGECREFAHDS